jgi:hypothetical protein
VKNRMTPRMMPAERIELVVSCDHMLLVEVPLIRR